MKFTVSGAAPDVTLEDTDAVGGSFTSIVTVAVEVAPWSSVTVNVAVQIPGA
jgi:hypothetical protein